MRVITRKRLIEFAQKHRDCESALDSWYRIMKHTDYKSYTDMRRTFPSADKVGKLTVFNIGGNKVRLIAAIHYNTKCVYIRHVLIHDEYGKGQWKKET